MAHIRTLAASDPGSAREAVDQLRAAGRYGRRLVDPASVGLAGRPNVGKSALANALLRHDRIIVHDRPGTTRDVIEEMCDICGLPIRLVDMAGLRHSDDHAEAEGVRRARRVLESVDLVLLLVDGSAALGLEDRTLLHATQGYPRSIAVTKCDLPERVDADALARHVRAPVSRVSATRGDGLASLEAHVAGVLAGPRPDLDGPTPFAERQDRLLARCLRALSGDALDPADATSALDELLTGDPPPVDRPGPPRPSPHVL